MPQASPARIDVREVKETLHRLNAELGDNGSVYRKTIREIKKAGGSAERRARGYLPMEESLPSGFTYKNQTRFPKPGAFPRYDRQAASSSIRTISARERRVRTEAGFRGGQMYGIAIEMRDRAGSVYDVAGNGKSKRQLAKQSNDPRSGAFISLLRKAWIGDAQWKFRVVLPAVVDTRPEIVRDIRGILARARVKLAAREDLTWRTIK